MARPLGLTDEQRKEHKRKASKADYVKHRDAYLRRTREWNLKNPERRKASRKADYDRNREQYIERARVWYMNNKERATERNKAYYHGVRLETLRRYGGNPPSCACCGETEMDSRYSVTIATNQKAITGFSRIRESEAIHEGNHYSRREDLANSIWIRKTPARQSHSFCESSRIGQTPIDGESRYLRCRCLQGRTA